MLSVGFGIVMLRSGANLNVDIYYEHGCAAFHDDEPASQAQVV